MKLEILLSCMHQTDLSLVEKNGIYGDVLSINQCNLEEHIERAYDFQKIRMISTTERGLSRSRNEALKNASGDICLLSDDDEVFVDNYEQIILDSYRNLPDADIIAFDVENKITLLGDKICKINYLNSLKLSSCQLSFRKNSILQHNLQFDPYMGAGTGNGCGEENKFLIDCLKKKLKIYYVPKKIAVLDTSKSSWFSGFDEEFFYQRGGATRYMMGLPLSVLYAAYYVVRKKALYCETISPVNAAKKLFQGILENPIKKQKLKELSNE